MKHLEQRLHHACDRFVSDVATAIEAAIHEAIQQAFSLALTRRPRFGIRPRGDAPLAERAVQAAPPSSGDPADAACHRVLVGIRHAPGSHVGQLSASLEMRPTLVRRYVRQLVAIGAIRVETKPDSRFGGQPLQTFFPSEPGDHALGNGATSRTDVTA